MKIFKLLVFLLVFFVMTACQKDSTVSYQGKAYVDSNYTAGIQQIPGNVQCEYYDMGGEGISFHDSDSTNSGSGALNVADGSYLHEFRMAEAVDISYTKLDDIDNNAYNFVMPEPDQLYIGWTEPGEWTKYTVDVQEAGAYKVGIMYTSNTDECEISLDINDQPITEAIVLPTTFVQADTMAWRQWHHWNRIDSLCTVNLGKGVQVLCMHTVKRGQANYDYLSFTKSE